MARTGYTETLQLKQLIDALNDTGGLEFPVCVEHRDKPDFVLSSRARRIGIEISSYTDEEVRRARYLGDTRFPNAFIPNAFDTNIALCSARDRSSNEEIIDEMFNWEALGEDIIEAAEHIARKIFAIIQLKRQKFHSPDFAKFDENWLMLTDYFNPFSDWITEDILSRHFGAACQRSNVFGTEFDRIYIFHGPRCFRVQQGQPPKKLDRQSV
jgi:hypothetical protein